MMSVWTKFLSALRAFRVAHGGNVAITFAFAIFPIIGVVGYAVDYSRANSVKVAMQAALDSTALMISKEAATDTASQLQTNARNYYLALFNRTDVKNITVNATYDHRQRNPGGHQQLRRRPHHVSRRCWMEHHDRGQFVHRQMGLVASARGAGARQHRIDGPGRHRLRPAN